ncbi:class I SAM-dependent methyltransferase [Rhodobacteraceae bacterium NNCM2]|nr:class I SAM-dependent methyltransferase [Coraliihabitans acroporae]
MGDGSAPDDLTGRLARLGRFFDLDRLANAEPSAVDIDAYYRANRLAYTLFHSKENVLHMAISRDGVFREEDFFAQSQHVEALIAGRDVTCLELAAGRAANSAWLARRHPGSRFHALDLSEVQLGYARKAARRLPNLVPAQGDYHSLDRFEAASIDIVFVIEALCYSPRKHEVFAEGLRVLKPDGLFVIYDGYADRSVADRTAEEDFSARLLEHGMAVSAFEPYASVVEAARAAGFALHEEEDLSEAIMPTCWRIAHRAGRFLDQGLGARLAIRLLPDSFLDNIVTGYLFPVMMERRIFSYMATVLKKPS